MSQPTRASCLCGVVAWEVDGPFEYMLHCHCSRCRKTSGAAYATWAMAKAERFRITSGLDEIVRYGSSPGCDRPFCAHCGSVVPDGVPWHGLVTMPAGSFETDPAVRPTKHIFAASRAPWVEIHDGLPRYDAYPPDIDAPIIRNRELEPFTGVVRGSCLCDGVRYIVPGKALRCLTCHCSRCRKASSATQSSGLITALDGAFVTRGEELLVTFALPGAHSFSHRFCVSCGSSMPRFDVGRGIAIVPMGSLDDDPKIRPQFHIFVESRAAWDSIEDGLPQYPAGTR